MISNHLKHTSLRLLLLTSLCLIGIKASSSSMMAIDDKKMEVAMRMVGHEVLLSIGDCESLVLPIEKIDARYKISFENQIGFDPGNIVTVVDQVILETKVATDYIVEVEQCDTKEIVHAFVMGGTADRTMLACSGRVLPEACYSLFITILDISDHAVSGTLSVTNESNLLQSILFAIPLLFLIACAGYLIRRKKSNSLDTHLILVGASKFDKRNMSLSFKDQNVDLSNKEAELLSMLHHSANLPVKREELLKGVWGDDGDYVGRTLDVFISKLRKKLEADDSVKIVNIRGIGYKLIMDVVK